MIRDSGKDLKDLSICFHEERNVLKQQVFIFNHVSCDKKFVEGPQKST